MGEPTGFYIPGKTKVEVNEIRRQLSELAAGLGYISTTGANKGRGSVGELLAAIAAGEVVLVRPNNVIQADATTAAPGAGLDSNPTNHGAAQ